MRLHAKEKYLSIHNRYFIKDENGKDILEIARRIKLAENRICINDINGKELAYIKRELFQIQPKYNVFINNNLKYSITRDFKPFRSDFTLSNNYRVEGQFLSHNFTIYNDKNEKIAEIFREYFKIADKYVIDIIEEKDYLLILTVFVAITDFLDRSQRSIAAASH